MEINTVFSVDSSLYLGWQADLLAYSHRKVRQPGLLTRLWSGQGYPSAFEGQTFQAMSYCPNPTTGDYFPPFNKPAAVLEWLQRTSRREELVLLLDPDCIFVTPFSLQVEKGTPVAQPIGYMEPLNNQELVARLVARHGSRAKLVQPIGIPIVIHRDDLEALAPLWVENTAAIRSDPISRQLAGWTADMWGYALAAVQIGLRHQLCELAHWQMEDRLDLPIIHYCYSSLNPGGEWQWHKRAYRPWARVPDPPANTPLTTTALVSIINEWAVGQSWQKEYFHGKAADRDQAAEHQVKLRLRDFSTRGEYVWQPLLEEPLRGRALDAAHVVAERMCEPEQVRAIASRAMQQSKRPGRWDPVSTPFGFTQIAFPFVSFGRYFSGQEWNRAAQRYLRLAVAATHEEDIATPALFGGSCGLASVLLQVSKQDGRYTKTLASLNAQICQQVRHTPWLPAQIPGVAASDYDTINGAAGILAYLVTLEVPTEEVLGAIRILVRYLIWLTDVDEQETRERWYIPPELLTTDEDRQRYPNGQLNCGLAHGITGPLAALAIAWHAGYRFAGLREAIVLLSHWVLQHQIADEWGINWPYVVPFSRSEATNEPEAMNKHAWLPARAAWCYGAPGMARALWLAGVALDDEMLRQTSIEAMEAVLRRPIVARQIASPNLCHGIAGLLQICLRFAHETSNETIRQHIPLLVTQILDLFNPDFALGFRDLDADGVGIDETTWLSGAPGTALALLAAATAVAPDWDRVLLIS